MINVVVPMVGSSQFFDEAEYKYPKPLIEINGKTMIELFLENFSKFSKDVNFIFIVNDDDCRKHHLDNVLNLLTDHKCQIIRIAKETKGAACSVLMAIQSIQGETRLIIANSDQILDIDFNHIIETFKDCDAGVVTFNSVHPKWSYVKLNNKGFVIESAEKKPLSNHAIAGFYYFATGDIFIESAFDMIKKDASVNGLYYISPVFNELVLKNKKVKTFKIDSGQYHSFYNPQKIKDYERIVECK